MFLGRIRLFLVGFLLGGLRVDAVFGGVLLMIKDDFLSSIFFGSIGFGLCQGN